MLNKKINKVAIIDYEFGNAISVKNALDYLIDFILLGGIHKSGPWSEHSYDFRIVWNRAHLPRLNIRLCEAQGNGSRCPGLRMRISLEEKARDRLRI